MNEPKFTMLNPELTKISFPSHTYTVGSIPQLNDNVRDDDIDEIAQTITDALAVKLRLKQG